MMGKWWKDLDRILRGDATRLASLGRGKLEFPVGGLSVVLVILGMFYGACMGCFALFKAGGPSYWQLLASTLKVPVLFVLTLAITLPSLYVFNALVGSRLLLNAVVRLLVASLAVMMAVLASIGPIVAFFSLSTTSYHFMILVNVLVFGVSGALGLSFLLQTLQRLSVAPQIHGQAEPIIEETDREPKENPSPLPGALDPLEGQVLGSHVKAVFRCWVILFGLVGAQMGWVLRPFIGDPLQRFVWFRGRDSNFFQGVWYALSSVFS